jgi:pimeloyl-[acyl-carrier protein] methyl ester esterase
MAEPLSVVLLPGLDGTGIMFEPFVRHLPAEWEPVVVRYPGDQCLGYDELLPIARAALPTDGPFILLGESFGGPLSIRLAAERPSGLCGLVLCATFAGTSAPWLPRFCHRLVRPSTVLAWQVSGRFSAWMRGLCPRDMRRLFNRVRHHVTIDVLATRVRETVQVDVTRELSQINVPMLYLAAGKDHVIPKSCLRLMLQHRPDIDIHTFDAAHWILQTQSDAVVAALRPFVELCLNRQFSPELQAG